MFVKICGNRSPRDIRACHEAGADCFGVLVGQHYASNDFVTLGLARELTAAMRNIGSECAPILVTHETRPELVADYARWIGADTIQLHGGSSPEQVLTTRRIMPDAAFIVAVHVTTYEQTRIALLPHLDRADYILLDTKNGITGQSRGADLAYGWRVSAQLIEDCPDQKFILAGGLDPGNVGLAIDLVRPHGVDVNSGIKGADGCKDPELAKSFVRSAKRL